MTDPQTEKLPQSGGFRQVTTVVVILILLMLTVLAIRILSTESDTERQADSAWSIDLTARVSAQEPGAHIKIAPPIDTRFVRLYAQALHHPGMRHSRNKKEPKTRDIVLVASRDGQFDVRLHYELHVSQVARSIKQVKPSDAEINAALSIPVANESDSSAAESVVEALNQDGPSVEQLVSRLHQYVKKEISYDRRASDDGETALKQRKGNHIGRVNALVLLLRLSNIPARVVTGIDLLTSNEQPIKYWCELYDQEQWRPIDLAGDTLSSLPAHYVPFSKTRTHVIDTVDADVIEAGWRIDQIKIPQGILVSVEPHPLQILDLTRLPPDAQAVLSLLLLLPLGALSTQILRQLIGIRTFGTFTPTLFALAVVYVEWSTAAIVFFLVAVFGIFGRSILPDLGLGRVSRLSIVFTLIAICMVLVVSGITYFDPSVDAAVGLLPIVVMTSLVDSFYSVADEKGIRTALIRLVWTVIAAVLSVFVLLQGQLGDWLLHYPEVHAMTIAMIMILGKHNGWRLTDLRGLTWLRETKAD